MTTYQININDSVPVGKNILALLQSLPDVISLKKITTTATVVEPSSELYTDLKHAFSDVAEIKSGKQKRQTLRELIDEL